MKEYFLGMDCSTQSLTSILIEKETRDVAFSYSINFDKDLPHYNTKKGVLILDEKIIKSPPLMWVEDLEMVFQHS